MVITLNPEPDWKDILARFANAPEQCTDRLPVLAEDALHAVRAVLGGQGKTEISCIRPASPKLTAWPPDRNPEGGASMKCQVLHTSALAMLPPGHASLQMKLSDRARGWFFSTIWVTLASAAANGTPQGQGQGKLSPD